jgi:hypothetical protein
MDISFRSCQAAGVATITAEAIAFVPSVKESVGLRRRACSSNGCSDKKGDGA